MRALILTLLFLVIQANTEPDATLDALQKPRQMCGRKLEEIMHNFCYLYPADFETLENIHFLTECCEGVFSIYDLMQRYCPDNLDIYKRMHMLIEYGFEFDDFY